MPNVTNPDRPAVAPARSQIEELEAAMLQYPQTELQTAHYFADGLYAREIRIPAGVLLTGKVHAAEHLNILSKGRITVWTEDGMRELCAPHAMVSRPGTKRVGLAHEDSVWTTIHANLRNTTDLDELEAVLIEPANLVQVAETKGIT